MHQTWTTTDVTLTATCDELATWESNHLAVYATPAVDDPTYAVQVYVGSQAQFRADFVLATVADFLAAAGLETLGWQERTEDEYAAQAGETLTCTVARTGRLD